MREEGILYLFISFKVEEGGRRKIWFLPEIPIPKPRIFSTRNRDQIRRKFRKPEPKPDFFSQPSPSLVSSLFGICIFV